jgi:hypothetical protein
MKKLFRRSGTEPGSAILYAGREQLEVVGESFHQSNLERTVRKHGRSVEAILMPEPHNEYDANAVAILVDDLIVGHLPREVAANYQGAITQLMSRTGKSVAVTGEIVGGDPGHFGIWLTHDSSGVLGDAVPSGVKGIQSPPMGASDLDEDSQPYEDRFNRARRAEREISELLGLCKGFLIDGDLSDAEIHALDRWMEDHPDGGEDWIVQQVSRRVRAALADRHISEEERIELRDLLASFTGGTAEVILGADPRATGLPLDEPAPDLVWVGSLYVFTGKFAFGTRSDCERATEKLGAGVGDTITKRTSHLVIGTFGSRDWVHSSFGRKIQKAAKYRSEGLPIAIVCEDHWRKGLD